MAATTAIAVAVELLLPGKGVGAVSPPVDVPPPVEAPADASKSVLVTIGQPQYAAQMLTSEVEQIESP